MLPSQDCYALIKEFEGLLLKAYPDPGSSNGLPVTIGWGSTMYQNGKPIKLGDTITSSQADILLAWEVNQKANQVSVPSNISQSQFDAIISFCYNLGVGTWDKSSLKRQVFLNPNDVENITKDFMMYVYNDHKIMAGLVRRRKAEVALYFKTKSIKPTITYKLNLKSEK